MDGLKREVNLLGSSPCTASDLRIETRFVYSKGHFQKSGKTQPKKKKKKHEIVVKACSCNVIVFYTLF